MEIYWLIVSRIVAVLNLGGIAYLFSKLIRPFLKENRRKGAFFAGLAYFVVMLILYFMPFEIDKMKAHAVGVSAALIVILFADRQNAEQKIFLAVIMYILEWISYSIALLPRSWLFWFSDLFSIGNKPVPSFVVYVIIEICYIFVRFFTMKLLVYMIDRVYSCKEENMTKKELVLMLAPPLSVLAGYNAFEFFSDIYLSETDRYIWNVYTEYWWLKVIYQIISMITISMSIFAYQKIRSSHRKEKEDAVLWEQIENMKHHIAEVEAHYQDIRRLRHDMGNHVMTLENLFMKNERQEAEEYLTGLKEELSGASTELKTGNPVTDVILTESKKRAESKDIAFACDFHFPEGRGINVFDISVILNNAMNNALEGAEKERDAYIHIVSYREKNAFMIEVENNFTGYLLIDEENGLPPTGKEDSQAHGYGLASIRAVAQKYFGDIDIIQDGKRFVLSVLLMLE